MEKNGLSSSEDRRKTKKKSASPTSSASRTIPASPVNLQNSPKIVKSRINAHSVAESSKKLRASSLEKSASNSCQQTPLVPFIHEANMPPRTIPGKTSFLKIKTPSSHIAASLSLIHI